jgi:hypothetical protein
MKLPGWYENITTWKLKRPGAGIVIEGGGVLMGEIFVSRQQRK